MGAMVQRRLLQDYTNCLGQIDVMEAQLVKAAQDFKRLKEGDLSLDDLEISETGWTFKEPKEKKPALVKEAKG